MTQISESDTDSDNDDVVVSDMTEHANDTESHAIITHSNKSETRKSERLSVTESTPINYPPGENIKYSNNSGNQSEKQVLADGGSSSGPGGQFVLTNTSLASSPTSFLSNGSTTETTILEDHTSGTRFFHLPTAFTDNTSSSTEKISKPDKKVGKNQEPIVEKQYRQTTILDPTFIFTTSTEKPSTFRTSLKSLNLFNSQYFNITTDFSDYHHTDFDDSIKTTSHPSFNDLHHYETEENRNSPQMYSEDMTEVIIIRKCFTLLYCGLEDINLHPFVGGVVL